MAKEITMTVSFNGRTYPAELDRSCKCMTRRVLRKKRRLADEDVLTIRNLGEQTVSLYTGRRRLAILLPGCGWHGPGANLYARAHKGTSVLEVSNF